MSFWEDLKYFTPQEFTCKCGCGGNEMKHSFMLTLDTLREYCGFPFIITSGYRCPSYNEQISTTGPTGPHTTGNAADVQVYGTQAHILLSNARRVGITGIGIDQRSSLPHAKRFIHLDSLDALADRPRPWVWTY